jgi:hypothetical protein
MVGAILGVGLLETQLPVSDTIHRAIEVGLVLGLYGLIDRWLKANAIARLRESMRQPPNPIGRRTVVESKPIEPAPDDEREIQTELTPTHAAHLPHITYRAPGIAGRLHLMATGNRRRRIHKM